MIDEVITTNYDSCLEKAYCDTFENREPGNDEDSPARVVACLNDYRENAGRVYVSKEKSQSCLKIYKINGCAKKFAEGNSRAESILLTESQLQHWRQRYWARDLFRDRLRSRTIVFSGFGSDEPQVRHTVLQVVEEFEFQDKREPSKIKWYNLPNAPFIAAYEKTLSFSQVQILSAFIKAHSTSFVLKEVHRNVFTGNDAEFFGGDKQVLTADLFWKRIFQVTFWRILEKYCAKDSSAFNYLSAIVPPAEALFQEMLDWYVPKNQIFGSFPEILDVEKGNNCIPLALWVWCVRYRHFMPENGGWYPPLKERPVLIPVLLLILHLIAGEADSWEKLINMISVEKGFFRIRMTKDGFDIFIAHQQKAFQGQETVDLPEDFNQAALVQVIISNNSTETAQRKRIKSYKTKESSEDGTFEIRMVSVYQVPFRELFRSEIIRPYSVSKAREVFRESLRQAFLTIDRARPRLRQRAKPI
ncbi:MAG: SIR2 family protein [Pelotomaculum sp.]|nr:SIR2 family protein [Pelotomaculum sp.]